MEPLLVPLPAPGLLDAARPWLLAGGGALLGAVPLCVRRTPASRVWALPALLGVASLLAPLALTPPDAALTQALVRAQEREDPGVAAALPGGQSVTLRAADPRARLCLKQAFAFPGQITLVVRGAFLGTRPLVLSRPPALLMVLRDQAALRGSVYHTCEVVDGRPTVRVQATPLSVPQGLPRGAS